MAWKVLISSMILALRFGCFTTETEFETEIGDGDEIFSTKLGSCSLGAVEMRDTIKCDAEKGDKGDRGVSGISGFYGQQGLPGLQGLKGLKGETGEVGLPGKQGQSEPGLKGFSGQKGERGVSEKGEKGSQGDTGPSGRPGQNENCPFKMATIGIEEGDDMDSIGMADQPANFLCHEVYEDIDKTSKQLRGDVWVFKGEDKFKVRCQEKTNQTCLIITPQEVVYFQENSIIYKEEKEPFWLSDTTFDLTKFYNNVTMKQIEWLQSKSTQVVQKIKYHCRNSYINENTRTPLLLYTWNNIAIGPNANDFSPFSYSLLENGCTEKAPKTEWRTTEIVLSGSSKRLPVVDLYIRDIREEDQRFSLELTELCFG